MPADRSAPGRAGRPEGRAAAPVRVLLADDQAAIRAAFRVVLSVERDIEVVGEAATGVAAVELARRLRPDVVFMDVRMPGMDGLAAPRVLLAEPDPPRVVVVTTFDLDEYVHEALRAGACGFLLKDAGPRLLVEAVHAAVNGDALLSPSVTVRLLHRLAAGAGEPSGSDRSGSDRSGSDRSGSLTPRELETACAVARGRTNAEIAAELFVTLSTVKSHLTNVQAKLGARNRVEIAAWAWENGHVR